MFVHIVLYWLKPGSTAEYRDQLVRDARSQLKEIPSVRQISVGRPAMTPRDIVDNSYDVGLFVAFDDRGGHDAYQVHELHQKFLATHKANWQRVQIYDFA